VKNIMIRAEDLLRGFLEDGFYAHEEMIRRELLPKPGAVLDCGCGAG